MKRKMYVEWCSYVLAICVLASVAGNMTVAAEEEGSLLPVDIAIDATYASAYYWRGASAGAGTSFMQPSADISYTAGPVTVGANVWYSQGIDGGGEDDSTDNSEIDYTVYVGASLGAVDISAGVIDYAIPGGAPFSDGHVLEANLGVGVNALPFDNSIAFYVNLAGEEDDSGDAANSMYLAPSLGTSYKNVGIGLTAGLALGESDYYGTEGAALVDITPSISYTIPGDAETSVSFNVGYNPNSGLKMSYVTLGTSFSID